MASNYPLCAVCYSLNETRTSVEWCSECDQALCSECYRSHSETNATKDHKTVAIEKYSKLPLTVIQTSQTCTDHKKAYQKYCIEHECLCCIDCVLSSHRGCQNIQNINDVVQNIKKSHVLLECDEILDEINENIKEVIKCHYTNAGALKTQRSRIENEIKSIRQNINNHLDTVENDLKKNLYDLEQKEISKINFMISTLKTKKASFEKLKSDFKSLKEHASNLQLFFAMKNIENEAKQGEGFIRSLFDNRSLNLISFSVTQTVTSIESMIPNIGIIHVISNPHTLQYKERQHKYAQQIVPRSVVRVEDIGLTSLKEVEVDTMNNFGCTFLNDNKYAVSSYTDQCIIVMKPDGSIDFKIDTKPHSIMDIVYVPSPRNIIATGNVKNENDILIIDIEIRKITRSIPVIKRNYGITIHSDKVVYCAKVMTMMDMKDHTVTAIHTNPMSRMSYVASFKDNLYYTNRDNKTVICCGINGYTKWQFEKETVLQCPSGICVDGVGFVFVAGSMSNNVVVISPDGLHHAVLLTSKDGLDWPYAIDYDKTNDVLLVVNGGNNKGFLFSVRK